MKRTVTVLTILLGGCIQPFSFGPDSDDTWDFQDSEQPDGPQNRVQQVQRGEVTPGTLLRIDRVVVTAVHMGPAEEGYGLFVADPGGGEYGGLWVYMGSGAEDFERGQLVDVEGIVAEFDGDGAWPETRTELDASEHGGVSFTGVTGEEPWPHELPITDDSNVLEPFEGVPVVLQQPRVLSTHEHGFQVEGGLRVADTLFALERPHPGDHYASIAGILDYGDEGWVVLPRRAGELQGHSTNLLDLNELKHGDLLVTELMVNPGVTCDAEADQFLELLNTGDRAVDLRGLRVRYAEHEVALQEESILPPGGLALLVGESPSPCYGHQGHALLGMPLAHEGAGVELLTPEGELVDLVDMRGWVMPEGASLSLSGHRLDADDNDLDESWCVSQAELGEDFGTPGMMNEPC